MKHTKFVLAALAAMSLTMPACGGDTKKEEKKTETKTEKTETKTETKEVTAPEKNPEDAKPADAAAGPPPAAPAEPAK